MSTYDVYVHYKIFNKDGYLTWEMQNLNMAKLNHDENFKFCKTILQIIIFVWF